MPGPRRHASRALVVPVLLTLLGCVCAASVLLHAGAASAQTTGAHHGLLGKVGNGVGSVVTKVGDGLGSVLGGVGGVLHPSATPTHSSAPSTAAPTTAAPSATKSPTHSPIRPGTHAPARSRHSAPPRPPVGSARPVASHRTHRHPSARRDGAGEAAAARTARPVSDRSATNHPRPATSPVGKHGVTAIEPDTADSPELGITAALVALLVATTLGVGLIVYRAGRPGARAR